jgi:predicted RNase H-like HicB family nuclease
VRKSSKRLVYHECSGDGVTEKQVEIQAEIYCEDGMYWAKVPTHPGLFASGETLDELTEALIEAWVLYTQKVSSTHIEQAAETPSSRAHKAEPSARHAGRVDKLSLLLPA